MLARSFIFASAVAGAALLAGCADSNNLFNSSSSSNLTTSSVSPATAPKVDPVCVSLSAQIDSLRKDGISEKVEKASQKKYKLTTAELAKADQLNKVNADFQSKCSSYKPTTASAAAPATVASAAPAAAAPKP